jgi:hypothetical protein
MTFPEFPQSHQPFAEASIPTSDILRYYASDVESDLRYAKDQLETDGVTIYDHFTIGTILRDKVAIAAEAGDIDTIDKHLETMLTFEDTPSHLLADAYLTGLYAGSRYASTQLETQLIAHTRRFSQNKDTHEEDLSGPIKQDMLSAIVDACNERGEDPTMWIITYGANTSDRWQLFMKHYDHRLVNGDTAVEGHINQKVSQLATNDRLPADFVLSNAARCIRGVTDDTVQDQFVTRLLQVAEQTQPTQGTFLELVDAARALLQSGDQHAPVVEQQFMALIDRFSEQSQLTPFEAAKKQLALRSELARASGYTPQDIIASLEQHIVDACRTASVFESSDHLFAMGLKANLLNMHAEYFAKEGDFAAASTFLGHLSKSILRHVAYQNCLNAATSPDQLHTLRPTDEELDADELLRGLFDSAEAKLTNDYDKLTALAVQSVYDAPHKNMLSFAVEDALQTVQANAPDKEKQFLTDILVAMRASGRDFAFTTHFSERGIALGIPGEVQHACHNIETKGTNSPSYILSRKWNLVKAISSTAQ